MEIEWETTQWFKFPTMPIVSPVLALLPPPSASAETGSRVKNRATARMALKSRSRGVRMV